MALVFFHVELDPLTRLQLRQAAVTHRTEVDEDILAPVDSDEPLPLLRLYDFTVPTTITLPS